MDASHGADRIMQSPRPETAKRTPRGTSMREGNNTVGDCFGANEGMTCVQRLVAAMACEGRAMRFSLRRGRLLEPAQAPPVHKHPLLIRQLRYQAYRLSTTHEKQVQSSDACGGIAINFAPPRT
jgi:hypothetical protein